jgi:16S rRNA (guanine(966)-N(2))-methyltransferase RsmD
VRILAGKYRRRHLQSTLSPKVRPTARRLREALFDLLGAKIIDARFLDLCAGSGAVGIEALSRGAVHATFVDRSAKMCRFIKSNLERCEIPESSAEVAQADVSGFLRRAASSEKISWDIVFFDPPYANDYHPVISLVSTGALFKHGGSILVVEHHCGNQLRDSFGLLRRLCVIRLGESCLSFYENQ